MTLPHDFVGPFRGSNRQVAVNLCTVESVTLDFDNSTFKLCVLGEDIHYVLTFTDLEDYNLAVSILRAKGVLPCKP